MPSRPDYIDLRAASNGPVYTGLVSPRTLPSPRLHVAGDIPPELSPLDAFAAQSRLLAQQLKNQASRESRLPPATITRALSVSRPDYARVASANNAAMPPLYHTNIQNLDMRPLSVHPTLDVVYQNPEAQISNIAAPILSAPDVASEEYVVGNDEGRHRNTAHYQETSYGARRADSPPALEQSRNTDRNQDTKSYFPVLLSADGAKINAQLLNCPTSPSEDQMLHSLHARSADHSLKNLALDEYHNSLSNRTLAPPRSPYSQKSASPRSASFESQEDYPPFAERSQNRKLSSGSKATSPISPRTFRGDRSPSISSQYSVTSLSRPSFNFSRPISRASATHDLPSRQASGDSQPSIVFADEAATTPLSMHGDSQANFLGDSNTYPTFTLPRGKEISRNFHTYASFDEGNSAVLCGPSTPVDLDPPLQQPLSQPIQPTLVDPGSQHRHGSCGTRNAESLEEIEIAHSICPSISDVSTIKACSAGTVANDSPEYHVTKGIECHEHGSLKESTYHLRIAARQNHPTGMLLYALACRHGWGMRANQKEGLQWLRKAADYAILEVADDDDLSKKGTNIDFMEQKTRKAQFALSVYELGVSHMNGWGIEQDKALALRCFEIAGAWGDTDALSEAGFCYAQGVGCKKDLKKSARFYRLAESKGVSMVGNSWIYKAKYRDDVDDKSTIPSAGSPDKKDKAKKSIFGRKK